MAKKNENIFYFEDQGDAYNLSNRLGAGTWHRYPKDKFTRAEALAKADATIGAWIREFAPKTVKYIVV